MGVQRTQVTMLLKPVEALEKNADVFMGSHVTGLKNSRSPLSPAATTPHTPRARIPAPCTT